MIIKDKVLFKYIILLPLKWYEPRSDSTVERVTSVVTQKKPVVLARHFSLACITQGFLREARKVTS